jgi:hypothetical protein
MNKKQWFLKSLIPIDKRLPPDTDQQILYWNSGSKRFNLSLGSTLYTQHRQLRSGKMNLEEIRRTEQDLTGYGLDHLGYFATHWMPLYPMEEG